MKFILVDRIDELEPGKRIVARKALTLAEEYLQDHFPRFPVLPGVLMLEALVQASAWLVRASLDFRPSLIVLKEARNVTYKSFLAPGQVLILEATAREITESQSEFNASGSVGGKEIVRARLTLRHLSLAEHQPGVSELVERLRHRMRSLFGLLWTGKQTPAQMAVV